MNNLPIMPIRVQYADETANGKNIDAKFAEVEHEIETVEVEPSQIKSGEATAGQVLTADGSGGSSFEDAPELDPSSLYGKFVRVIDPPESTTLTDEEIELFEGGVFVNGNFLGTNYPVLFPTADIYQAKKGWLISTNFQTPSTAAFAIFEYTIDMNSKIITRDTTPIFQYDGYHVSYYLFKKHFPTYPSDDTKEYALVQEVGGDLAFKELSGGTQLYKHTITGTGFSGAVVLISNDSNPITNSTSVYHIDPSRNSGPEIKLLYVGSAGNSVSAYKITKSGNPVLVSGDTVSAYIIGEANPVTATLSTISDTVTAL